MPWRYWPRVNQLKLDPFSAQLFAFRNRRATAVKVLLAAAFLKRGHDPQVAALAKGAQDLALHALRWHPLAPNLDR
jgi:hypothetical protein